MLVTPMANKVNPLLKAPSWSPKLIEQSLRMSLTLFTANTTTIASTLTTRFMLIHIITTGTSAKSSALFTFRLTNLSTASNALVILTKEALPLANITQIL